MKNLTDTYPNGSAPKLGLTCYLMDMDLPYQRSLGGQKNHTKPTGKKKKSISLLKLQEQLNQSGQE